MIAGGQNLLLGQSTLNLVPLDHLLFAQHYQRQPGLFLKQAKTYPNTKEEKKRLQLARAELEKEMEAEKTHARATKDTSATSRRNQAE